MKHSFSPAFSGGNSGARGHCNKPMDLDDNTGDDCPTCVARDNKPFLIGFSGAVFDRKSGVVAGRVWLTRIDGRTYGEDKHGNWTLIKDGDIYTAAGVVHGTWSTRKR